MLKKYWIFNTAKQASKGGEVGVKLEQMVLVTDSEVEVLSHYPFEDNLTQ